MLLQKVTTGFVIQTFDTEKNRFIEQQFVAGDPVDYENSYGESLDHNSPEYEQITKVYQPYDMVQPEEN
jgi:hypothetical protein